MPHYRNNKRSICPYCHEPTGILLPADCAPIFVFCDLCMAKFIAVHHADSFKVMTEKDAPCYNNFNCIELEMGGYDEEELFRSGFEVENCS